MKRLLLLIVLIFGLLTLSACFEEDATSADIEATFELGEKLAENQPTPVDVNYSLERYNLIKRLYWVNGILTKLGVIK